MSGHDTVPAAVQAAFAPRLIAWQRQFGRHGLPWQTTADPYRVWLSEIMLQQTQVSTVLGYYERFLARFSDVRSLAQADVDDILALWSGLGYYSRARNLHACARRVVDDFGGVFPTDAQMLATLPGIGPSTAAAIAAFCFGQRISIFDGNVRRVCARFLGFSADLSIRQHERALQAGVDELLPDQPSHADMVSYTQGLMDLGATVCTRSQPRCGECPMQGVCVTQALGAQALIPLRTRRVRRTTRLLWMAIFALPDGRVWLARRPAAGIWASLYAFPFADDEAALQAWCDPAAWHKRLPQPSFVHVLTHADLVIHPVWVQVGREDALHAQAPGAWVSPQEGLGMGIPQPVRNWLARLADGDLPAAH